MLADWRAHTGVASPPLEVVEFGHRDFTSPSSEQSIFAVRASKADFAGALSFWVKAMEATGGYDRPEPYLSAYAEAALCEPIASEEFSNVVSVYSGSLVPPLPAFLLELTGWESGLRMYNEWNDVVVTAETAISFVLFAWGTSA